MIRKDLIFLVLGRMTQAVVSLIAIRVLTTFLSASEVGYYYLIMSICGYFGLVFMNPTGMYLNRMQHEFENDKKLLNFLRVLNVYFFCIAVMAFPTVLVLQKYFGIGDSFFYPVIASLVFFLVYGSTLFTASSAMLNMFGKRSLFVIITSTTLTLSLGLSIVAILFFQKSISYWLAGNVVGQFIGAGIAIYYLAKNMNSRITSQYYQWKLFFNKEVLFFCIPIAISTFFMWLMGQSYRLVIEKYYGPEQVGYLALGLSVAAAAVGIMESITTQYFYPSYYASISKVDQQSRSKSWNLLFKRSMIVYLTISAATIASAQPILNILVHQQYRNIAVFFIWGVFIELFRVITNVIYLVSQSEMNTKRSITPYGAGGLTVLGGVFLVSHFFPDNAISYVPIILFLGSLTCLIMMFFRMKKIIDMKIPVKTLFKTVLLCVPMLSVYFLTKEITTITYSLLAGIVIGIYVSVILFLSRNELKDPAVNQ